MSREVDDLVDLLRMVDELRDECLRAVADRDAAITKLRKIEDLLSQVGGAAAKPNNVLIEIRFIIADGWRP